MCPQVAVRIPDETLADLDEQVKAGRYPSRAAAMRAAIEQLLRVQRELEIAEEYRRAYGAHPQEEWIGEAGLEFMAQIVAADEARAAA